MNTNYNVVENLIEILVKRAGFDIKNNYSEEELVKVKSRIQDLQNERENSNNKKTISKMIDDLKVRQASWENNAEIVGKSLLDSYKEGKSYQSVKMRIELLTNLANKNNSYGSLSNIYDELNILEEKNNKLKDKIENSTYESTEEKEMDERYKKYLEDKIKTIELELDGINKTLDELRESEKNDVNIVNKVKDYIKKLESDLEKINSVLDNTITSYVGYESFENIEKTNNKIIEKIDKFNELLKKTENVLNDVRNSRKNNNERKSYLEKEIESYNSKLNRVSTKLEDNDYINIIEKIEDINKSELIKLEIRNLNNVKDVLYIDTQKVKEELIREWEKRNMSISNVEKPKVVEEVNKEIVNEKEVINEIETKEIVNKTIEDRKEEKNKIELDW